MSAVIILIALALAYAYLRHTHRIIIISKKDTTDMAAIDDLNAAVSRVQAYVATLRTDLANADQTPAIEAATDALNAIAPAPVADAPVAAAPDNTISVG
jgi:predicted Mrr-cat superfamily restriction endonuclease